MIQGILEDDEDILENVNIKDDEKVKLFCCHISFFIDSSDLLTVSTNYYIRLIKI